MEFYGYSLFTPKEISCQNFIINMSNIKISLYEKHTLIKDYLYPGYKIGTSKHSFLKVELNVRPGLQKNEGERHLETALVAGIWSLDPKPEKPKRSIAAHRPICNILAKYFISFRFLNQL